MNDQPTERPPRTAEQLTVSAISLYSKIKEEEEIYQSIKDTYLNQASSMARANLLPSINLQLKNAKRRTITIEQHFPEVLE